MAKPAYQHLVIERHVPAARQRVWDDLLAELAQRSAGLERPEELLSSEPPWRLVSRVVGAPAELFQVTACLVPEGEGTIFVLAVLYLPSGDSTAAFVERSHRELELLADRVVGQVTAS